ncbi:hypothetical protein [Nonomuraea sediminis]|uniref:hypothetical protein n=1 Tax=Nonomuraea sediminis TaxID=2835864 RepID=UPI001BDD5B24|nr:hypothetical protein [Nonomuraea sediminis]
MGSGDDATWSQDRIDSSPFWGSDEPPGWPAPPDQIEVTGQWRPAPERNPAEAAGSFASEPIEKTGAFLPPTQGEPFETTGAFTPPPGAFDPPGAFTPPPNAFEPPGAFTPPPNAFEPPGAFTPPPDAFTAPPGAFEPGARPSSPAPDAFGVPGAEPFETTGAFTRPPLDDTQGIGSFDGYGPGSPDATAVYGAPPAPGDVRVAGNPTMVNAPTPAWADASDTGLLQPGETGFLGEGWSGEELPPEEPSGRRRGRRRPPGRDSVDAPPNGRGKVALLSVAAVAVVLGGTVAGVKLMGSSGDLAKCPGGKCAAVQASNQPGPLASTSAPVEDSSSPSEEPTEAESDSPEPTTPTGTHVPRRTQGPQATPTPTATKKVKVKTSATPTRRPTEQDTLTPTDTPSDDSPTSTDAPTATTSSDTGGFPTGNPTSTTQANAGSVNLTYNVVRRGLIGYTAKLSVANSASNALASATVSIPLAGKVLDVKGADWSQDGDLLILDVSSTLAAGDSIDVTIDATGSSAVPQTCGLVGGNCSIT